MQAIAAKTYVMNSKCRAVACTKIDLSSLFKMPGDSEGKYLGRRFLGGPF